MLIISVIVNEGVKRDAFHVEIEGDNGRLPTIDGRCSVMASIQDCGSFGLGSNALLEKATEGACAFQPNSIQQS